MNTENMFARNIAVNIANTVYETSSLPPTPFLENHWSTGYMDTISGKSDSIFKLSIIEFLKIFVREKRLVHINTEHINKPQIRANLFQYKFAIDGKEFYCLSLSQMGVGNHPLIALVDSIIAHGVEHGCERCGFSEEGCEACGFNKARRALMNMEGVEPFSKTASIFFEAIGEGRTGALMEMAECLREKLQNVIGKTDELVSKMNDMLSTDKPSDEEDEYVDDDEEDDDDDEEEDVPNLNFVVDEYELENDLFDGEDEEDENDD